jgi:hypothetical protein
MAETEAKHQTARDGIATKRKHRQSYERMLALVNDWEPPTQDHVGLKDFMVQQITDSIEWDCDESYYQEMLDATPELPSLWLANRVAEVRRQLSQYRQLDAEEHERVGSRNQWKQQLFDSLGVEKTFV